MLHDDEFEVFQKDLASKSGEGSKMTDQQKNLEAAKQEIERQKQQREADRLAFEAERQKLMAEIEQNRRHTEEEAALGANSSPELAQVLAGLGALLQGQTEAFSRWQDEARGRQNGGAEVSLAVVPDIQNAIHDFYGNEKPEIAQAWIRELENIKGVNSWSDAVAFNVAKAHLKNAAFKWYLSRVATVTDFPSFVTAFKATFTLARSMSEKLRLMSSRNQKAKETTQEYFLEKVWLCSELNLSCTEVRDEVAEGLWSREMANHILGREYLTTDEILQDILKFEKIESSRRERITGKKNVLLEVGTGKYQKVAGASLGVEGLKKKKGDRL